MTTSTPCPGVYLTEIAGGVRTITGVATSVTAFLGKTRRGPMDPARARRRSCHPAAVTRRLPLAPRRGRPRMNAALVPADAETGEASP